MDDKDDTGIDGAVEALSALQIAIDAGAGITYLDDDRNDGKTNKQILEWHAQGVRTKEGLVKRDITLTDEDRDKAAKIFEESYREFIEKKQRSRQPKKATKKSGGAFRQGLRRGAKGDISGKNDAKAALASAMRKAAKSLTEVFKERWQGQKDNKGASLRKVTRPYAADRLRRNNIAEDVVFERTGQLGRGIEQGRYELFFDPDRVDEIKQNIVG